LAAPEPVAEPLTAGQELPGLASGDGKRILVLQPNLGGEGGGQGVCAWILQALCDRHEVTVLTWDRPDFADFDHYFGTSLQSAGVRALRVPAWMRATTGWLPVRGSLLYNSLLVRHCRRIGDEYDLLISANNEWDLGKPGIQYVHYPWARLPRPAVELRWFHLQPLMALYYAACSRISGVSRAGIARNLTYVNSRWTADQFRDKYGLDATVLHPPVIGDFPEIAWEQRRNAFICCGRISPEKRLEHVIDILDRVRRAGSEVDLHIVGVVVDRRYSRRIAPLLAKHRWITLHTGLERAALVELMAHCRYGIHAMHEEHFGMAPAEMVRAGCVTFVHDSGGPREIIGDEPRLRYRDDDDAVAKVLGVLRSAELQHRLSGHIEGRGRLFSVDGFVDEIRRSVAAFASR